MIKPLLAQMRLLWNARRVYALLAAILVCSLLFIYAYSALIVMYRRMDPADYAEGMATYFSVFSAMLVHLLSGVSVLWAIVVWRSEGPSHRSYHWSLPVDLRTHDVLRVCAGALWMLGVSLAFAVITLVASHTSLAGAGVRLPISFWLSFVTATMIPYMMGSAIGVASDRPAEWILGLYVSLTAIYVLSISRESVLLVPFRFLFEGRFGVVHALGSAMPHDPKTHGVWTRVDHVDLATWGGATVLWAALSISILTVSMYRVHRRRYA
jgi:hypothetical protein